MAAHVLDYVLYGFLMALGVAQGLYVACRRRRGHDVGHETFLGGRSLGVLPLAVSVLASTGSPLGLVAMTAHFYAYGLHTAWTMLLTVCAVPLVVFFVVPGYYRLGVTSIFQYIRIRYNTFISLTACLIYLLLTQSVGAALIFSAALTASTIFGMPIIAASIVFGFTGTYYAAVGGLRAVVWTDCLHTLITMLAPLVIIAKVAYDSTAGSLHLRPFAEFDIRKYILDTSPELTKEENVWACLVGGAASFLYRLCFDQMAFQRYMASKNINAAQRTAIAGALFCAIYYLILMAAAVALIFRFRDCDPLLSNSISSLDQLLPFYVKRELAPLLGFSGIFLASVVSSSISTVSSIINAQTAILYVDVVSQYSPVTEPWATRTTRALAFATGITMTAYSLAVPFIGSAMRVFLLVHSAVAGPFVGLMLLAIIFPNANSKGAGVATCLAIIFQIWHLVGKFSSGIVPDRMPVTLEYCSDNTTNVTQSEFPFNQTDTSGSEGGFIFYRLSSFWSSLFSVIATIIIGIVVSVLTGGRKIPASPGYPATEELLTAREKTLGHEASEHSEANLNEPEPTRTRTSKVPEASAPPLLIDREELERLAKETQV
ncbi:sodium-coupled monocarboxylate transporter 2-like isoform X2 [Haemaphysalis longicornis]